MLHEIHFHGYPKTKTTNRSEDRQIGNEKLPRRMLSLLSLLHIGLLDIEKHRCNLLTKQDI